MGPILKCDSQSTKLTSSCGVDYCVTYQLQLTGNLESDVSNLNATNGTLRRKPTVSELLQAANTVEALCD